VRFRFIDAEKANHSVRDLCRNLRVSRSGFYAWRSRPESQRRLEDRRLTQVIRTAHRESRCTYGSPRLHAAFHELGERVSRKRIARLMREAGLEARRHRRFKRTTDSNHPHPIAPNILDRQFMADRQNLWWVGDITYVWTDEGWLYLAVLLDVFSRRVVGWSMASTITRQLALDALQMALDGRAPGPELGHHSDRGSQYASNDYRNRLKANGITCSMSRRGNGWDNALSESFFGSLKIGCVDRQRFATRAQARAAIFDYIEVFYNRQRRHSTLGNISPAEFELRASNS
jgi:transposase InsO family protein